MSYFTGTANNSSDLQSLVETKAVLAGWTLTSGWLNKGINHVQLTSPDAQTLNITGANSDDGLTTPAGVNRCIWVQTTEWPVTYYLFVNTTPDTIVLVVKHATDRIQTLLFGNIVKIHDSAYVGGNFFYATNDTPNKTSLNSMLYSINNTDLLINDYYPYDESNIIPFTKHAGFYGFFPAARYTPLHVEIDGNIWQGNACKVTYTDTTISSLFRSPNTYNSQTHLIPMNLQYAMADSLYGYLGYLEHIRLIRVDNYEIGNIITISPDQWMVFPWYRKNVANRNGGGTLSSGTVGFAVRYTP